MPIGSQENEKLRGSYVSAPLNPEPKIFKESANSVKGKVILEVGCGKDPRISWSLEKHDLWVGCDPAIKNSSSQISVQKGSLSIDSQAKLFVFSDKLADIPTFYPNIISLVAPNQKDIVNDEILNNNIERFLNPRENPFLAIVLDTRTQEALKFQSLALDTISHWTKDNGFIRIQKNSLFNNFRPNSADLGTKNLHLYYTRKRS